MESGSLDRFSVKPGAPCNLCNAWTPDIILFRTCSFFFAGGGERGQHGFPKP